MRGWMIATAHCGGVVGACGSDSIATRSGGGDSGGCGTTAAATGGGGEDSSGTGAGAAAVAAEPLPVRLLLVRLLLVVTPRGLLRLLLSVCGACIAARLLALLAPPAGGAAAVEAMVCRWPVNDAGVRPIARLCRWGTTAASLYRAAVALATNAPLTPPPTVMPMPGEPTMLLPNVTPLSGLVSVAENGPVVPLAAVVVERDAREAAVAADATVAALAAATAAVARRCTVTLSPMPLYLLGAIPSPTSPAATLRVYWS